MSAVEEIKSRLRVEEVVGEYIPLLKAGYNLKALCPFHQEKTPSFSVSPERQVWHCFGCGEGGDLISFVQKYEGVEFPEALRMLAEKAGVTLTNLPIQNGGQKKRLFEMHEVATRFFVDCLLAKGEMSEKVRSYLAGRGVTPETMTSWRLGLAPDSWDALGTHLIQKGFSQQEVISGGLAIAREGKFYDRFRRRLMFPIADPQGRVVAFTARTLFTIVHTETEQSGKYVNSPQTPIYHKSAILYGFDQARQEIRRLQYAIIVEGNMDVVMSHQAGIKNVVAVSGTALTRDQLMQLQRYTPNIILAFDADTAGSNAVFKGITTAWELDMNVKVISLKEGKDPADVVLADPEKWRAAIRNSIGVVDFYFDQILARVDLSRADHKKLAARRIGGIIAQLKTPVEQAHYSELLAQRLSLPASVIRESMARERVTERPKHEATTHRSIEEPPVLSEYALSFLAQHPKFIEPFMKEIAPEMLSMQFQSLYKQMVVQYTETHPADHAAFSRALEGHDVALWSTCVFRGEAQYGSLTIQEQQHEFEQLVRRIRQQFVTHRLRELTEAIQQAETDGHESEVRKLLAEYQSVIAERNQFKS